MPIAKQSLAFIVVPKCNLGTRGNDAAKASGDEAIIFEQAVAEIEQNCP